MRWVLWLHRYAGIAVGWLIAAWCLSGVAMMYVAFPEVSLDEQLSMLPALDFATCCKVESTSDDGASPFSDDLDTFPLRDLEVEMLADEPIARLTTTFGATLLITLRDGRPIDEVADHNAARIARVLQRQAVPDGTTRYLGTIERDQWTVTGYYDRDRPLHHFALDDAAGTEWYISSTTGKLVQATNRRERVLGWLGPVIHWSYPTVLRQDTALWIDFLIWTCSIGLFLTVLGLYVGIVQLKRRRSGRWSPYRGVALWHHYLGLFFGLLALTWIASGLLSVNPWGLLEGAGAGAEVARTRGPAMTMADAREVLGRVAAHDWPRDTIRIETAPFDGRLYLLAYDRRGNIERVRADTLEPARLDEAELDALARKLRPGEPIASAGLIYQEDAFHFNHHQAVRFPVYRVILADAEQTRYYLDATTGRLLRKIDSGARGYRWLFEGLHRLDFTAWLRSRPMWDVLMIVLLMGVSGVSLTGTYMGVRYLVRQVGRGDDGRTD